MSSAVIINAILIILIVGFVAFGIYSLARGGNKKSEQVSEFERERLAYNIDGLTSYIKNQFDEITRMNLYDLALSEDEFERRKNTKYELKKALKGAGYADSSDKKYVKTLMFDLFRNNYKVNDKNINYAINFDNLDKLTPQDKFEILLHVYKKKYNTNAFSQIVTEY